jgi:hypothetical protein
MARLGGGPVASQRLLAGLGFVSNRKDWSRRVWQGPCLPWFLRGDERARGAFATKPGVLCRKNAEPPGSLGWLGAGDSRWAPGG